MERQRALKLSLIFLVLDAVFLRWVIAHFHNWGFWDWDYQQTLLEVARTTVVDYGQIPLWNPYLGGGISLAGNTLNHVWSPSFLPILLFGTLVGIKLCIFIYLAIAQLGMFRLARSRGLGEIEACLSAIVFSFAAVYAQRLTHGQFEWIAIAWVPFVLLAIDRFIEQPSARAACCGGIFYSLIVLDGGPYQFAFFGVFLAVYAIARAVEMRGLRPLVGLVSIGGVAVGLAAIKLIPVFELVGRYPRETNEDPFYGAPFTPGALDSFFQMFLSRAQAHDPQLWMPYVLNVGSYVGIVPLLLVGLAIYAVPRKHVSWILSGFFALWVSLGPAAPIDLWHFLHQLPGLSMLRVPSRFNVYALLCIALLAGVGLGVLREKLANPTRARIASLIICIAVAANLIFVNGAIFKVAFSIPPLELEPRGDFRQHYSYSPFIERYRKAALYDVHPNWPSGSYPAVLENRGVRWAFKTLPFPSAALSAEDPGYWGEAAIASGNGTITELSLTPNRVRVSTDGGGGLLKLNINYDPGWQVVGGEPLSLAEFDGVIGINLPSGRETVELAYRPRAFFVGAAISVLTLLGIVYVFWMRRRAETKSALTTALVVGLMSSLCACSESTPRVESSATNVVLITVDTLRADRTGPYREKSKATPNIAKLASQGTLFEAAISPMQMTRPSHYSLFTSLYPRDHGVVNNKISLEQSFRTLAEVFREHGYATAAFVSVTLLGPDSGAERGFEHFDFPRAARTRSAEHVVSAAVNWLDERPRDKPFFIWVHFFDPHTPYAPPAEFAPVADGPIARTLQEASIENLMALAEQHGGDLPEAAVERAISLYQGEIEYTDHWIGRLMEALDVSASAERTAMALTADHGECFEKGIFFEHSDCLYEGAARIPLIFRAKGRVAAGVRRSEVVEILDVAPTLLALADLPVPAEFLGRKLFDKGDPARDAAFLQHPLYSNSGAKNRRVRRLHSVMGTATRDLLIAEELIGLRTSVWKYLLRGSHEELYHLPSDPAETRNVATENRSVVLELREQLKAWSTAHPQRHANVELINDELRATLEALGYLQ